MLSTLVALLVLLWLFALLLKVGGAVVHVLLLLALLMLAMRLLTRERGDL